MGVYENHILPRLIHFTMKAGKDITRLRAEVVPAARGRVLEIGIGSGLNLPFYGAAVDAVHGVDPSPKLLAMARKAARGRAFAVELVRRGAEELPFADASFDTVLTTWTLCSIADAPGALGEMRRVLGADGELIFIEHGLAPSAGVGAWQHRLTPLWRRCAGGCHLDRGIDGLIRGAGFAITEMETGYMVKGPRPWTYHYRGRARRAA